MILAMALVTLVPFAFVHVFQHDVVDVVTPVDARATDMAQQADRQGVVAARAAPRAPDVALPDVLQPHVLPDDRHDLVAARGVATPDALPDMAQHADRHDLVATRAAPDVPQLSLRSSGVGS